MSDTLHDDFILQLANLPGGKPWGDGKKGPRRVATPGGAAYYGQPIGTIITADLIEAKRKENAAKGIKPEKGMLASGGNKQQGTPAGANPQGTSQPGGSTGPGASASAGSGNGSQFPVGGNVHKQVGYPAPGLDSTPPDWMGKTPEPQTLALGVKDSSIAGPKKFKVGEASFNAPEGSRIIRPKDPDKALAIIITPDKQIHFFNQSGEVDAEPTFKKLMLARFGDKVPSADTMYSEDKFDEAEAVTLDKITVGQSLNDPDGIPVFKKGESGWTHIATGLDVSDEDVQPLYDSGELVTTKPVDEESIDDFDWGDDDDIEIAFSEMSNEDFVNFLDSYEDGEQLYLVSSNAEDGEDTQEFVTWTKNGDQWLNEEQKVASAKSLGYVKSKVRTIKPVDLQPWGTAKKQKNDEEVANLKTEADKASIAAASADVAANKAGQDPAAQSVNKQKALLAQQQADAAQKAYEDAAGITDDNAAKDAAEKINKADAKREADAQKITSEAEQAVLEDDAFENAKSKLLPSQSQHLKDGAGTTPTTASKFLQFALPGSKFYSVKDGEIWEKTSEPLMWKNVDNNSVVQAAQLTNVVPMRIVKNTFLDQEKEWTPKNYKSNDKIGSAVSPEFWYSAPAGSVLVGVMGEEYHANSWNKWINLKTPQLNLPDGQLLDLASKGDLTIKQVGDNDAFKFHVGDPVQDGTAGSGEFMTKQSIYDSALPGTELSHIPSGIFAGSEHTKFSLGEDGLWSSGSLQSYELPDGDLFITKLPDGVQAEKPLGVGDNPTAAWMQHAPVGAGVISGDGLVYVKKENGLFGYPGSEGVNSPQQMIEIKDLIIGDPDEPWEEHSQNLGDIFGMSKAGEVLTPEKYLAAPNGTKFKYTKKDNTQSDYVKVDDTTVLMPGGVYQPIHHWNDSVVKGKVSFAEDTSFDSPLSGISEFDKPDNWSAPEPLTPPTGDSTQDGAAYQQYIADLYAWEKEANPEAKQYPQVSSLTEFNKLFDGAVIRRKAQDYSAPGAAPWVVFEKKGTLWYPQGTNDTMNYDTEYLWQDAYDIQLIKNGTSLDEKYNGKQLTAQELADLPVNSVVITSGFFEEGQDDLFYKEDDGWYEEGSGADYGYSDELFYDTATGPIYFHSTYEPEPIPGDENYETPVSLQDLIDLEVGSLVAVEHPDHDLVELVKQDNGDWAEPLSMEEEYSAYDVMNWFGPGQSVTVVHNASGPQSVPDALEALDEPIAVNIPGPGSLQFTPQEVYDAIAALENHSHGSPVYGLKSLDDENDVKNFQVEIIAHAKTLFPGSAPKAAVIALLKSWVNQPESEDSLITKENPTLHLGADKPAKNQWGVTGGDFKQSDIEDAVTILEGYAGKQFKSALKNAGNPLGNLDFNSLIGGVDKDKLAQKQKVIDHLKKKIQGMPAVADLIDDEDNIKSPYSAQDLGQWELVEVYPQWFYDQPQGKKIQLPTGEAWVKDGPDSWIPDLADEDSKPFSNDDIYDEWQTSDPDTDELAVWLETPLLQMLADDDVMSLPTGSKIQLTLKKTGAKHVVVKEDGFWTAQSSGGKLMNGTIIQAASQGRVHLISTPENKPTPGKVFNSIQDVHAAKIGTVVKIDSGNGIGDDNFWTYTKTGQDNWEGTYAGSASETPFTNADFTASLGKVHVISEPDELPSAYVAPPAAQSKFDADGNGPVAQSEHSFAPGLYQGTASGGAVVVYVFADGSAHYNDKGTMTPLLPEAIAKFPLNDSSLWEYKGVSQSATEPVKPAVKIVKPTISINPKDIPDGLYYNGHPNNANTATWEVKSGVITQFNSDGTTSPVSNTKLKNAVVKGALVDKFGNSKVLPKNHIGPVKFLNKDTNSEALKQLRKQLEHEEFDIGLYDSDINLLAQFGVHVNIGELSNFVAITQGGQYNENVKAAIKDAIDGMLGDIADYPEPDLDDDAVSMFEWAGGTGKAHMPEYAVPYVANIYPSTSEAKAGIVEIGSKFGGGKIIGQHVTAMNAQDKRAWLKAFREGNFKAMYNLEVKAAIKQGKSHISGYKHPGYPDNVVVNKVEWAPAVVGEKGVGDEVPGSWTELSKLGLASADEINNYLIAAGMSNPVHLTSAERRNWVKFHREGNQPQVDALSVKARQSSLAGEKPVTDPIVWVDDVKPAKAYNQLFDNDKYPVTPWNTYGYESAADEYFDDFKNGVVTLKDPSGKTLTYEKDLKPLFDTVWQKNPAAAPGVAHKKIALTELFQSLKDQEDILTNTPVYTKSPTQNVKKSKHPIYNYQDQFGNKYLFKPAAKDEHGLAYRAAVEAHANDISRLFGSNAPKTQVVTLEGKIGFLQAEVPHVKTLQGFNWSSADKTQTVDLAHEHMIDWMLDQDDNWAPNTLIGPDGHLVGIDKGRSFLNYGKWNGMVTDSSMDVNTHLVYSDLYQAIIKGEVSKEVADATWLEARKRSIKMSKADDARLLELLHAATDGRSNWKISYKIDGKTVPQTQQGFFDAFFDRKAKLPQQVEALWMDMYKKAGYGDLPEPQVSSLGEGQHSGLDDANFHTTALTVGSVGTSTIVNSPNVIGGTVTVQKGKNSDGSIDLNGAMQLGPKAEGEVLSWFKSNSDASALTPDKAQPGAFTHDDVYAPFLAAAKTIGAHAEDGAYNQGTLKAYDQAKKDLDADLAHWAPGMVPDGDKDFVQFPSGKKVEFGQVDQYKMMLDHYSAASEVLEAAIVAKAKPASNITKFEPITLHDSNVIYLDGNGQKMVKLSNGQWIYVNSNIVSIISNEQATEHYVTGKDHANWTKWGGEAPETPKVVFKAVLSSTHNKEGELKDFELSYSGSKLTSGNKGNEYEVTLPTGEKIYYRNGQTTNTIRSQQGRLSFRLANVKNETDVANGMEHVRSWISDTLKIDLDAADLDSAELTYWREMYGILENRNHKAGSPWAKAKADLDKKVAEIGGKAEHFIENFGEKASIDEQNAFFRDLWGKHFGKDKVDKLIASEGFLPYYENYDLRHPDALTGNPQWTRFDVDLEELQKKDVMLVSRNTSSSGPLDLVKSGGAFATEERMRVLGKYVGGMSSGSDQSYGSANFVFTRIKSTGAHSGHSYVYHPRAMLRTRTYSFNGDHFGRLTDRKGSSPSNPLDAWINFEGGSNETMLPHAVALLGDLEMVIFDNAQQLNEAIQFLKKLGFEKIRGVPIEERLVLRQNLGAQILKLKKTWYS